MLSGSRAVQIFELPSLRRWKAKVIPSGAHAGCTAGGRIESSVGTLPSAFATQRVASVLRPSAGQRVNASLVPSGDQAGRVSLGGPVTIGNVFSSPTVI